MPFDLKSWLTGFALGLAGKPLPISQGGEPVGHLTFASAEPFTIGVLNAEKNWDGILYYSTDTATWNEWDGTTAIASAEHSGEQKIYMCGSGNTRITGDDPNYYSHKWVLTGSNVSCNGNIENLLDYKTVASGEHPQMADYCYYEMFQGCTSLTQAPALPATTLASHCYSGMFNGCTSLTQAPALPATTLADYCYSRMFIDCTSLTQAPALPATTLASHCYERMFYRCTSLTQAPALPATTLAHSCYWYMFNGCTSLTQAPALPATTLANLCYLSMFQGCTSLTQAPALPATTLAHSCYEDMFNGCTSLKISATQTATYTNKYRIPTSGTGTTATTALNAMFANTGGTFTGTPNINTTYYLHKDNTIV